MKSFIEYRKNKLIKGKKLNIQESIVECFDLLRLDLLNSIKLPDILSENTRVKATTESAYEVCKKEDYQDNKQIIELIISEFKNNFWLHLISEATATAEKEPEVTADDLKKQMSDEIDSMVGELKQLVSRSLSASRTTTGSDAEDAATNSTEPGEENSSTQKLTTNQAKYISDLYQKLGRNPPSEVEKLSPLQASRLIDQLKQQLGSRTGSPSSVPTSFQFNTNQSSGSNATGDDEDFSLNQATNAARSSSLNQPQVANGRYVLPNDWKSKYGTRYGTERPSYPDGFKPAPYGHMKPSDGWLSGLKRTIWDPATGWLKNKTRNFRRRWHRDEFREHFINLENIFLENAVEIMGNIDAWTTRLKDIILNKYFNQIKDFLSGDVQSLPKTKDSVAGKTGDVSPRKQSPAVDAGSVEGDDDDDDVEYEDDKDVEDEDSSSVEDNDGAEVQAQNSPQGTKIEAEAISLNNGFNLGAELLGIKIKPVEVEGGKQKIVPSSLLDEKEQPISEKSWAKVRNYVIDKLLAKMLEDTNEPERSKTIFRRKAVGFPIKYAAVKEWLDIKTSGTVEAIKDLLFAYYRKVQRKKGRNIVLKTRNNRSASEVGQSQVRNNSAKTQGLTPEQEQIIRNYKEFKENNKELFAKFMEALKRTPGAPGSEEELEEVFNKDPFKVWSFIKKWIDKNSSEESQESSEESQESSEESQESSEESQESSEESQESSEESQELKKKSIADQLKSSKKSAVADATSTQFKVNSNRSVDEEKQVRDELDENEVYQKIYEKYQNYLISKGLKGENLIDELDSFDEKIIKDILSKGKDKIQEILATQENLLDNLIEKIKKDPVPENSGIPEELESSFEKLERDTPYKELRKYHGDSLRNEGKDEETIKKELHEKTLKHAREMLDQEKTIKQITQDYEKELGIRSEEDSGDSKSSQKSGSEEEINKIARDSGEVTRTSTEDGATTKLGEEKDTEKAIKEIIGQVKSQGSSLIFKDGKLLIKNRDSLDKKTQKLINKHRDEIIEFLKPKEKVSQQSETEKTTDNKVNSDEGSLKETPEKLKNIDGYDSLRQEIIKIINDNNNQVMRNILIRKESEWLDSDLSDDQIRLNLQELKSRFEQQTKKNEGFLGILKRFKKLINS